MDPANWIALASTGVALVAVVVGPAVSLAIARRQVHASVVSSSRRQWLDAVRDDIAELSAVAFELAIAVDGVKADPQADGARDRLWEGLPRAAFLATRLRLRLNPEEPTHQEVFELARQLATVASEVDVDPREVYTVRERLLVAAQGVLKLEWERVKTGE